jgi:hypothetical protein
VAVDDLPTPVVNFLNVIGVPWPYIDEDAVGRFAKVVREFAQAVENTHRDASDAISRIADAHQGSSTEAMSFGWSRMSAQHVHEVIDACHVLADALDGAAGYIVAQKLEAVGVLVATSGDGCQGFSVDPAGVRAQTAVLRARAATMRAHGDDFAAAVGRLGF